MHTAQTDTTNHGTAEIDGQTLEIFTDEMTGMTHCFPVEAQTIVLTRTIEGRAEALVYSSTVDYKNLTNAHNFAAQEGFTVRLMADTDDVLELARTAERAENQVN